MKPFFSVIIPVRFENDYLRQTRSKLKQQTFKSFELLVITDKISGLADPSIKRNLGAKKSRGQFLVFLDDDSYPPANYLKNIKTQISKQPALSAFCGPCLTPPEDNLFQQASGLVWQSYLGSGGAGHYRNYPSLPRFVDDFPTVNLVVKKTAFDQIGGFQSKYWPGEDTIFCLDLIKSGHQIYYHPTIRVFHHRRSVLVPHLEQIRRFALHRGLFARKFPQTSFRFGYLLPSFFAFYLIILLLIQLTNFHFLISYFLYPLYLYLSLLSLTLIDFIFKRHSFLSSLLAIITIPITHILYGLLFLVGFFSFDLKFIPHRVNSKTGKYLGG